jgi:hypothetical protein
LSSDSETAAWVRYFEAYFPVGRNDPEDARLLFGEWRTHLLKDDSPGPSVALTHGQSPIHWQRNDSGQLCINLESMWEDFDASVDAFIGCLRNNPERREIATRRWREQIWEVGNFTPAEASATVISSQTALSYSALPPTKPPEPPKVR